jgi:hypothetical protein
LLGNSTRRKLRQHDLLTVLQKDSNPTQARHRLRTKAIVGLKDLVLLSKQTPSHVLEEFLPMSYILTILDHMMGLRPSLGNEHGKLLDVRSSELAAAIAEKALTACIRHHTFLFKETEALGEPVLIQLKDTISICRDLAYKIELITQDKIALDENLMFLFKWSKISQKGIRRLSDYIEYEMDIPLDLDGILVLETSDKFINMLLSIPDEEEPIPASITIQGKDSARLHIDFGKKSTVTNILDIKESNSNRYVFGRKTISENSKKK